MVVPLLAVVVVSQRMVLGMLKRMMLVVRMVLEVMLRRRWGVGRGRRYVRHGVVVVQRFRVVGQASE